MLLTSLSVLFAEQEYIKKGGISRGSYIVQKENEELSGLIKEEIKINADKTTVTDIRYADGNFKAVERSVSPLPESEQWFEKVYNSYR